MSRGGRGSGRGGRGGTRGGGRPNVPWDTGDEPDARPSELFPPYVIPTPRDLSSTEISSVQHFLLLRHQIHSSPLYTSKRTSSHDPTAPRKMYGQAQMNARYGIKNKASVDPFTAMPTYSQKFVREERALPDWSARPMYREMFPAELLETVEPEDGAGVRKKRRLELSKVSSLPNAEEAFGMPSLVGDGDGDDEGTGKNLLEKLEAMHDDEGDDGAELEDDEGLEDEEDEAYDDEDAGDYDAENYFDNGDEMGDDYGDGDDGEGTY
ncbi:DNA-directed RNA polymerase III subunit C31 [Conoideocrella luteorostrata]|uniref:DNA-directed RNA polymerase III subunit n=1 Tax=Conoideocrella luteorostrata TaxID=1105319 RepID=A0AAJ0CN36_9HYPO|nr:DNA-directed RNA polymerase III subunit C31 [Conoideocrella luteorostrata]